MQGATSRYTSHTTNGAA